MLITASLTACGGGDGGSGASGQVALQQSNSYLPAQSDVTWDYGHGFADTYPSTVTFAGKEVTVLNYPSSGKEYFHTTADKVSFMGLHSPYVLVPSIGSFSVDFRFDEPLELFSNSSPFGSKRLTTTGTANISPDHGLKKATIKANAFAYGVENVHLNFGTVEAVKVNVEMEIKTIVDNVEIRTNMEQTLWFAENIGIVKRYENGQFIELLSYNVPSKE